MARLLQLSDLHLVPSGEMAWGVLDTPALLDAAVTRVHALLPAIGSVDAALISGDVSEDGSEGSYDCARAVLARLDMPLLVIPGNHESREGLRRAFPDLPGMAGDGPIDWSVDFGVARVIGLDTLVDEDWGGGRLRAISLSFLRDAIATAPSPDITLAVHHPPLRSGITFMDAIALANADALRDILDTAPGPVRIVAGHVHSVFHAMLGRHPVSTAPSVCSGFALDQRPNAHVGFFSGPRGFAVIETGANGYVSALPLDRFDGPFPFQKQT